MDKKIQRLPQHVVNQIAAGEVVERPAAVVKELVENALDAGATDIRILLRDGGRAQIQVEDNGSGMHPEDLKLSIEAHATSKLPDLDLWSINTLGFRGEALPSIAAVARVTIVTRTLDEEHAWKIEVAGGVAQPIQPAARPLGTTVTVRDLFFATPARLKFLRSERSEHLAVKDLIRSIAVSRPDVAFSLTFNQSKPWVLAARNGEEAQTDRLCDVLGNAFVENSIPIDSGPGRLRVHGWIGIPTYTHSSSREQLFFVRGRMVRDRQLQGALKGAYAGVMAKEHHPAACIFIDAEEREVDVNAHPAKTEVRFVEPERLRGILVSTIRRTIASVGPVAATTVTDQAIDLIVANRGPDAGPSREASKMASLMDGGAGSQRPQLALGARYSPATRTGTPGDGRRDRYLQVDAPSLGGSSSPRDESRRRALQDLFKLPCPEGSQQAEEQAYAPEAPPATSHARDEDPSHSAGDPRVSPDDATDSDVRGERHEDPRDLPLGRPIGQAHSVFILSETRKGIILIDMHACHERVLLEKLKRQISSDGIQSQRLLVPYEVELDEWEAHALDEHSDDLGKLGLVLERSEQGVLVTALPALLGRIQPDRLLRDLAAHIAQYGDADLLDNRLNEVLSTMSCHRAIRAGDQLGIADMNALLREVEATPNGSVCNHGRPAVVELGLPALYKLFDRT